MTPELWARLEPLRGEIEQALADLLEAQRGCPARLAAAMRYSVLGPGKRLRPILVLLACEATGGEVRAALPAACAVELTHAYSLVHDDLPGMDDDDWRRGRPTCHKQYDEATAILVGDGLLTLAFQILAEQLQPPTVAAACVADLARGAGVLGMVGGQMDDLLAQRQGAPPPEPAAPAFVASGGSLAEPAPALLQQLESIHRRKTGALFQAALRIGGRIGAATAGLDAAQVPKLITALDGFAAELGLAFQIADDLLDVTGDAQVTGKAVQKDAGKGKLTYPGLLGIEAARQHLAQATSQAVGWLAPFGERGRWLRELVTWMGQRQA